MGSPQDLVFPRNGVDCNAAHGMSPVNQHHANALPRVTLSVIPSRTLRRRVDDSDCPRALPSDNFANVQGRERGRSQRLRSVGITKAKTHPQTALRRCRAARSSKSDCQRVHLQHRTNRGGGAVRSTSHRLCHSPIAPRDDCCRVANQTTPSE